jgi:ubiquinone/menaquinone biosynthesis C-methylase UbiE
VNIEKRDFDKEAASWDENPARIKLAKDVAHAVAKQIQLTKGMDVLDFGCGTGLLTIELQLFVRSVTGVDSSRGMIDVLKKKIAAQNLTNVTAVYADLDRGDILAGNYDLVVSSMTLHHIKEIRPLFDQFYGIIAPAGHLCITDLDPDNGQFHNDNTGVFHFGFERADLRNIFTEAGFDDVRETDAAEVLKPGADGKMRRFSVFLMTGRRR